MEVDGSPVLQEFKRKPSLPEIDVEAKKPKVDSPTDVQHQTTTDAPSAVAPMNKQDASHLEACKSETGSEADKTPSGNWQCWSHQEEIFLVGAVLERFFSRGSLSSTKREANYSKHNCWEVIKHSYDDSWKKYTDVINIRCPPERSENALSRHYKVMKERSITRGSRNCVDFKAFYEEWEQKYNQKYNLLPHDEQASDKMLLGMNENEGPFSPSGGHASVPGQSRGRWNYMDEVLLIGIVIETFFKRGSLSSSHKERMKDEKDFWQNIHSLFLGVKEAISQEQGTCSVTGYNRTPQALARHFKVTKVKLIESRGKLNLKSYHRYWVKHYRVYYVRVMIARTALLDSTDIATTQFEQLSGFPRAMDTKSPNHLSTGLGSRLLELNNEKDIHMPMFAGLSQSIPALQRVSSLTSFPQTPSSVNNSTSGSPPAGISDLGASFPNPLLQAIDINQINDLISASPGALASALGQNAVTQKSLGSLVSPQPIVTTNGNATTYWLPLTLYNNDGGSKNSANGNAP